MAEEKKLNAPNGAERQEPTKEQLKNWCDQLMMQRNQLADRLNQVTDVINMLPWLFEVVKNKDLFDSEFVDLCVRNIKTIMTPPEEGSKEENKE